MIDHNFGSKYFFNDTECLLSIPSFWLDAYLALAIVRVSDVRVLESSSQGLAQMKAEFHAFVPAHRLVSR